MSSNIKLAGKIPQTTVESMQRKAARDTLVALHGQLTDAAGTAKDGRLVLLSSGNPPEVVEVQTSHGQLEERIEHLPRASKCGLSTHAAPPTAAPTRVTDVATTP